ncbi:MAG TPA: BatA domain-containing protein [Chryseosolibacter sp.]
MTFLYPSFLWALGVLAIPVIIHLFNFRRTSRIYFSNTKFLKLVKEVTTAKRRLKHYLILASRLLLLTFLVLAFAQPIIPAEEQMGNGRSISLYIDNSQSMSAQMPDRTRGLDASLNFAQRIVELFPQDTRYKILTNDFAPFSNTFKTRTEALDILAQIRISPVSRSVEEIKQRLEQDGTNRSREFFWISDFQKSTAGAIPVSWDSSSRWHLVPIAFSNQPNVFLDTAYLDNPFAAGGERNILTVKVRNDGDSDVDQLNLKLTLNNVQAGTATISIPPKGVAETSFELTGGISGMTKAVVSFNDFPISFDNTFYLGLNFSDKINIVEIKPGTETTPVQRVFGNKQVFNFQSFSVNNFNYSLLNQADLVVVNGLDRIDPSLSMSLRNYLNETGTVLLVPGTNADAQSYQQMTGNGMVRVAPAKPDTQELDKPDFNNPFFANVFEERSVSIAMPRASRMLEWGADGSAILRFKNDAPFLSRLDQRGTLYLLASPLKAGFSDFYNHALFVPVMYRIAGGSKKNDARLYHTLAEDFITLRLDSIAPDQELRLVGAQEIVPSQRRVGEVSFLEIPKFSMNQGFYQVVANRDTVSLLAFNLDKAESLLEQFKGNEMKELMGNGKNVSIFEAESSEAFSNEIKARYLGKPLWKYAIMLALFFLLVEVLLIRFLK